MNITVLTPGTYTYLWGDKNIKPHHAYQLGLIYIPATKATPRHVYLYAR